MWIYIWTLSSPSHRKRMVMLNNNDWLRRCTSPLSAPWITYEYVVYTFDEVISMITSAAQHIDTSNMYIMYIPCYRVVYPARSLHDENVIIYVILNIFLLMHGNHTHSCGCLCGASPHLHSTCWVFSNKSQTTEIRCPHPSVWAVWLQLTMPTFKRNNAPKYCTERIHSESAVQSITKGW